MTDLPTRIEQATGPCRELDLAIADAAFSASEAFDAGWCHSLQQKRNGKAVCPRFTGSIDAALSLVPKGWNVGTFQRGPKDYTEIITAVVLTCIVDGDADYPATAPTLPLAICIAALRARQQGEG